MVSHVSAEYTGNSFLILDSLQMQYPSGLGYNTALDQWNYDTLTRWDYNPGTQTYSPQQRYVDFFDAQHNLIQREIQAHNPQGWSAINRILYTYVNGSVETVTSQNFNGTLWMNIYKTTYTRNSSNQLIGQLLQNVDPQTSQFTNHNRYTYSYDNNGNMTNELRETYNTINQLWQYNTMRTNAFDTKGNMLSQLEKLWSTAVSQWTNNALHTYSYNSTGHKTEFQQSYWSGNVWVNAGRTLYTYDNDDNNTIQTIQWWNGAYANTQQITYTYNNFGQALTMLAISWDNNQQAWVAQNGDREERMYYEEYPDDIKQVVPAGISNILLFPNPAGNELNLHIYFEELQPFTVSVYDMTGKMLKQWNEAPAREYATNINTTGMPSGTYILKLGTGATQATRFFSIAKN